jgi:NADH-quinone oxidoreductase subunit G
MSEELVSIEVDGVALKARRNELIMRVTDRAGIYIPRFCYHEKLSIAANCRMCLVEVEKAPKPLPACATPVSEGMRIFTRSARAIGAQRATMEFLLINHPLDCPICDQGGECELQDLALGFGRDVSRFVERKRVVKDKNLGPLISTDMTRCIHCTRCVRFGQDIAGIQELGATGRGEHMEIGTYVERSVDHELSGNIIDLCPVGALNSKPFRYRGRGWEMTQAALISPHDGTGTQIYGHVLRGRLMRVVPRACEEINETWIADRDRFSYEGIYAEDRLASPQLRGADGQWRAVEWEQALEVAAATLRAAAAAGGGHGAGGAGGSGLGLLAHPSSTLEELYLLARLAEGLGTAHVDHRLRRRDFSDQTGDAPVPGLGHSIAAIDELDALRVVGANLRGELPILAHRGRKATLRGARVSFIGPVAREYLFPVAQRLIAPQDDGAGALAAVLRAALGEAPAPPGLGELLSSARVGEAQRAIAASLREGSRCAIWLGGLSLRSARYTQLRALARALAAATGATLGELAEGGNGAGAYLAGVLPHRGPAGAARPAAGLDARAMLARTLPGYLLLHCEPWADAALPEAIGTLEASPGVVAVGCFASPEMRRIARVLLPAAAFAETSGSYVNLEGRWQSQAAAAQAPGIARPAWKILRVLGNLLGLADFDHESSEAVRDELRGRLDARTGADVAAPSPPPAESRGGAPAGAAEAGAAADFGMYQIDPVLRRAQALQRTAAGRAGVPVPLAGAAS